MGFKGVPDRWEDYSNSGNVIKGTRFISFKVPLKSNLLSKVAPGVDNNWGIPNLIQSIPDLGLVIDLTYTSRYYDYRELEAAGLKYSKIMTMGHSIPNHGVIQQFFKSVNSFLAEDPSKLIGCILFHYFLVFIICFLFISLQSHLKERKSIDHTRYLRTHYTS
ncbi:RNA/RNP complex-1-interacting phosphatase-like [Eurytemora carolleeae]|uniref:RNA/RNP complex-1-interacting phosphatase-like n=1 Tax=Eurytemora carolleeae TaxID=1294199 RepID=UPI000C786547|nr:RNA/RNP complex-1-interacting phosphatase-like [Eurytemora carolleeae]|eukprot:XP_023334312.1 RNA/RNP complex-1-interacting phosphatase-like [Eurytemora affinis]